MHKGKGSCDSPSYMFKSKAEAEKAGGALGLSGSHTHTNEKGETLYMPGENHEAFEKAQGDGKGMKSKYLAARDAMYQKRLKDMGAYRKYGEKKVDHPPSAHKKKKKKSPYADGVASDAGTVGRELDNML